MPKVICFFTRKKWVRPRPDQVAAKVDRMQKPLAGGENFQPVGFIAERITRRLSTR